MDLTRGERFKDARTIYNQHGKQTMDEVEAATGIKKSLIQALEDDENNRDVGCSKVVTLATHYHVTADFLLGFSNDPYAKCNVIDELGISPAVADRFIKLKCGTFSDLDFSGRINRLLENDDIWHLLLLIYEYTVAAKVDVIYRNIVSKYDGGPTDDKALLEELQNMAFIYEDINAEMHDFLSAKANIINWDGNDSLVSLGMEEFELSELYSLRISRQLEEALYVFRQAAEEDGVKARDEYTKLAKLYMERKNGH